MSDDSSADFFEHRYRLLRACRHGARLVIDGVDLDLNHVDLDRSEWDPISLLGEYPTPGLEPALDLPWTKRHYVEQLKKHLPVVEARAGDRVIISKVEELRALEGAASALDHPHHREKRIVHLSVVRSGGEIISAVGGWLFGGVSDVLTPIALDDLGDVRRALIARFERMTGLNDLYDEVCNTEEAEWNIRFTSSEAEIQHAARMLWKSEDYQEHAGMAFGYLIGRAEARDGRRGQAKSASRFLRKTGNSTRQMAISVIDASPNILFRRCAEQVAARLGKNPRSVGRTIRCLFRETDDGSLHPDMQSVEALRSKP